MAIRTKATLVKYLVVSELSSINKREIKRLTGSAIADEVKFSKRNYNDWGNILHRCLINAFAPKEKGGWRRELKIYEVDDKAYSTMYALKDSEFLGAIAISEDLVNRLNNLLEVKADIERITHSISNLVSHITGLGKKRLETVGITIADNEKYENLLTDISDNYARAEYETILNEINKIIKPSW